MDTVLGNRALGDHLHILAPRRSCQYFVDYHEFFWGVGEILTDLDSVGLKTGPFQQHVKEVLTTAPAVEKPTWRACYFGLI